MAATGEQALLDDTSVALVESTHAAKVVAVPGPALRATLVHAYACRVGPDRQRVTVTLDRSQAAPVLVALGTSRRIALVACHIGSLQSLQLKGDDARFVDVTDADRRSAAALGEEFARFGATLGYGEAMMRAHMACRPGEVMALEFTVRQAFIQTPGPSAGQPLAGRP
ncbi:MAG: hypothetical protein JNK40_06805 [Chromatiales bacterium]|nr:hypothetical protein [Chromatiales bacterium]